MDTPMRWRKSSYSGSTNNCVEVADLPGGVLGVAVRDSKNPAGPHLAVTATEWTAFVELVRSGAADFGAI